ncbi:hypothetical protein KBD34_00020 [Patescibacteria group bacterium]|nr:hypothetical protein [Patescibacteria group bacterium]
MLIACIGPDVYRALEKGRELEQAFRQKYDPEGTSIERLQEDGGDLVDEVIERVNTVSLFTPRRFLRVRDLLKGCPKGRVAALNKALSVDPENVIVVTVESDVPNDTTMKALADLPKWVRYDFPILDTRAFQTWIRERATVLSCSLSERQVEKIAEQAAGDAWQASLLLLQAASGTDPNDVLSDEKNESERSLFEWADAYLRQDADWRAAVEQLGPESLTYPFLSQLRAYQRVKSGQENGLPSFVARKLRSVVSPESEERFARLLEAVMLQRQGYVREDELSVLF